jgi:hypothetical protein
LYGEKAGPINLEAFHADCHGQSARNCRTETRNAVRVFPFFAPPECQFDETARGGGEVLDYLSIRAVTGLPSLGILMERLFSSPS